MKAEPERRKVLSYHRPTLDWDGESVRGRPRSRLAAAGFVLALMCWAPVVVIAPAALAGASSILSYDLWAFSAIAFWASAPLSMAAATCAIFGLFDPELDGRPGKWALGLTAGWWVVVGAWIVCTVLMDSY
jgi:hypothetical protein